MTGNEQSQLRFDISEKVTLHRNQPGIDTLLALDLVPEVRIDDLRETVKIHGVIRLTGTYIGQADGEAIYNPEAIELEAIELTDESENSADNENIHYVIPVEITLPSERAGRLEDITAEIASFDYEVLGSHELTIEAVLVIDGLRLNGNGGRTTASFTEPQSEEPLSVSENRGIPDETVPNATDSVEEASFAKEAESSTEETSRSGHSSESAPDRSEDEALEEEKGVGLQPETEGATEGQSQSAVDDITNKDREGSPPSVKPQGTKIHFHKQKEKEEPNQSMSLADSREAAVERQQTDDDAVDGSGEFPGCFDRTERAGVEDFEYEGSEDGGKEANEHKPEAGKGIQWMKEKLGGDLDRFHKLKMVIVQKEDTLESIAERYDISSYELLQVNRLDKGDLEQGQIVYIPERKN